MKRIASIAFIFLVAISTSAQWSQPLGDVPAYNAAPPPKGAKLPHILAGAQLSGPNFQFAVQRKSYIEAAKIASVLHQLPCYCHCDRTQGHNSLRSCFESEHGAQCTTCMQEAFLAADMTRRGKTPKQIRAAIMKGEFSNVDLQKINTSK